MFAWIKKLFGKAPKATAAPDKKGDELERERERARDGAFKGMMVDARRDHPGSGAGYK